MLRLNKLLPKTLSILILVTSSSMATQFEVAPYVGAISSSDLTIPETNISVPIESSTNIMLGIAWQESPNGQGQILLSSTTHDFTIDESVPVRELDIIYAHFNGIAQFRQRKYVTTVSVGLGAARFRSDGGSEISPSFTAALGTRYELSNVAAIVTELRGYASLMQDGDTLFCQENACAAEYDDTAFISTSISIGFAYKF